MSDDMVFIGKAVKPNAILFGQIKNIIAFKFDSANAPVLGLFR
jgi:hypothetical protein